MGLHLCDDPHHAGRPLWACPAPCAATYYRACPACRGIPCDTMQERARTLRMRLFDYVRSLTIQHDVALARNCLGTAYRETAQPPQATA